MDTNVEHYFWIKTYGAADAPPVFLVGGWRTIRLGYTAFVRNLLMHGFRCVLYIPRGKLIAIGAEYSEIVTAASILNKDIDQRLAGYDRDDAALFGVSIGTVFAMEAAKRCNKVNKVVLLSPGGDFSEHILLWQNRPYFSRILKSQSTTPTESGKVLNQVGALQHLELLRHKKVLLGYISDDNTMHTPVARKLATHLRAAKVDVTVREVKGNHATGLFRYLLQNKSFLKFLSEK